MPIVDGLTSTKLIRSYEKTHSQSNLSPRVVTHGRVPIFAVSASLVESERQTYIDAGFDGWILKPIDFKRLNTILTGIADDETRIKCLYEPGQWEVGGWFERRRPNIFTSWTVSSNDRSIANTPRRNKEPRQPDKGLLDSGSSGEKTPVNGPARPLIYDERLDRKEQVAGKPGLVEEVRKIENVKSDA
jgi:CheY-like chemotaxis protein